MDGLPGSEGLGVGGLVWSVLVMGWNGTQVKMGYIFDPIRVDRRVSLVLAWRQEMELRLIFSLALVVTSLPKFRTSDLKYVQVLVVVIEDRGSDM